MNEARPLLPLLLTVLLFSPVFAQDKAVPVCSEKAFAAVRPQPKLAYECSESLIDSDSRILRPAQTGSARACGPNATFVYESGMLGNEPCRVERL